MCTDRWFPLRHPGRSSTLLLMASMLAMSAAAAPTVTFRPEPICGGQPGTEFEASIWVDGSGDSLGCFHLLMTYDRSRLTLVSAREGDLFGSHQPSFFLWEYPGIDTTAFTDCLLGNRTYVLGPGELVKLTFRVLECPPQSQQTLDLVTRRLNPPPEDFAFFADIDRELIPGVTYVDGSAWLCDACAGGIPDLTPRMRGDLEVSPNPATNQLGIWWILPPDQRQGRLQVLAANGRIVFEQDLVQDRGSLLWDLRDTSGDPVVSGVYFALMRSGGHNVSRKILRVR